MYIHCTMNVHIYKSHNIVTFMSEYLRDVAIALLKSITNNLIAHKYLLITYFY